MLWYRKAFIAHDECSKKTKNKKQPAFIIKDYKFVEENHLEKIVTIFKISEHRCSLSALSMWSLFEVCVAESIQLSLRDSSSTWVGPLRVCHSVQAGDSSSLFLSSVQDGKITRWRRIDQKLRIWETVITVSLLSTRVKHTRHTLVNAYW